MSINDSLELSKCPFCGGEADEYEGDYGNGIYCMRCGAMVGEPIHLEYRTTRRVSIDEAAAAWNTRHVETCRMKDTYCGFVCSSCGFRNEEVQEPSFCPSCGRKVDG